MGGNFGMGDAWTDSVTEVRDAVKTCFHHDETFPGQRVSLAGRLLLSTPLLKLLLVQSAPAQEVTYQSCESRAGYAG